MFTSANKAIDSYKKVRLENGVDAASPHALILMLFDGAMFSLATASHAMKEGRVAEKGKAISEAISIISSGLQASLNAEAGGELAGRLNSLYDYMCDRLLHANLRNDPAAVDEIAGLLAELRSAWREIGSDSAVISGDQEAA